MTAGASYRNRTDDHQLVELRDVRKFGDGRDRGVPTVKQLVQVQVHLRHPVRGTSSVMVVHRVDHQAAKYESHVARHFVQQSVKLSGFDESRDIVVRVEALF